MANNTTLLTPTDVIRYGDVKLPFSPCSFRELYQIEFREARECIGFTLWESMVAAVADYSSASEYQSGVTYPAGTVVSFQGTYKKALVETSRIPSLATDWENAPKFNPADECSEAFNHLYCSFLGPYLAKVVLAEKLAYIISQIGDRGVNYGGRSYSATDQNQIDGLKGAIYRDQRVAWGNMVYYLALEENATADCFAGWAMRKDNDSCSSCNGDGCNNCRGSRQRSGLYDFG